MRRLLLALSLAVAAVALPFSAQATVTTSTASVTYSPGVPTTVFTVTYPFLTVDDLIVTKIVVATGVETTQTRGVNYSVTLPAGSTNGYITMTASVTSTHRIRIDRSVPYTQTTSFKTQGAFLPKSHEDAFDKLTMEVQQIRAAAGTSGDTAVATHVALADPHTQYALLAGRASGQHLKGGTAASENLQLSSTANGTKGKILVAANGTDLVVDEVNHRVGIGTATPSLTLDVLGDAKFSDNIANALHVSAGHIFKTLDTGFLSLCGGKATSTPCGGQLALWGPTSAGPNYAATLFGDTITFADASVGGLARLSITAGNVTLASGMNLTVNSANSTRTPFVYGGTGVAGNLKLSSTTDATKGKIYLGSALTSAFDEANGRLGIGTGAPAQALDVVGAGQFTSTITGLVKLTSFGLAQAAVSPTDCGAIFATSTNTAVLTLPTAVQGCVITLQNTSLGHGATVSAAPAAGEAIAGSCAGSPTGAGGNMVLAVFSAAVSKKVQSLSATENRGDYISLLGVPGGWYAMDCRGVWQSEP